MAKTITKKNKEITSSGDFVQYIKGLILSLIVTFACILIFALVIKFASLSNDWIVPVNLVIKAISILIGTIVYTKSKTGGLKKGLIFAVSYITLSYVVFSALSGSFNLNISLLLDYVFGIVVGIIVGVIRVNTK